MPVRILLDDDNSLPQEKNWVEKSKTQKSWVEKSKTQKSIGVLKNIENFDHNLAENDDYDDGRILKTKMPVRNLLDKNNKKLGRKVKNLEICACFKKYY